jgi:hypothetical protein
MPCSHCSASTAVFVRSAKVLFKADGVGAHDSVKELINRRPHQLLCGLVVQCRICPLYRRLRLAIIQPKRELDTHHVGRFRRDDRSKAAVGVAGARR